jgi:hypothetical protein
MSSRSVAGGEVAELRETCGLAVVLALARPVEEPPPLGKPQQVVRPGAGDAQADLGRASYPPPFPAAVKLLQTVEAGAP